MTQSDQHDPHGIEAALARVSEQSDGTQVVEPNYDDGPVVILGSVIPGSARREMFIQFRPPAYGLLTVRWVDGIALLAAVLKALALTDEDRLDAFLARWNQNQAAS